MPCEILIKTDVHSGGIIGYEHPNPEKDMAGVSKKGYFGSIFDEPKVHRGFKEGLPYFCAARIVDATVDEVNAMIASSFSEKRINQSWKRRIEFSTVNNNIIIDGWRISVTTTNPGFSNLAGITREMVENYLIKWNGVVHSVVTNEVQFDIAIYEDALNDPGAIQSWGFWGVIPTDVSFSEILYVEETGVHTIEADYSLSSFSSEQVQKRIKVRDGVVVSDVSGVIVFTITRTNVFHWFQQEVKKVLEIPIYLRQFRISEANVDTIISTGTQILVDHYWDAEQTEFRGQVEYRVLDVTLAQVENIIINRLDEDL